MSLNPLSELKRRLDDDETPLPKRLCLARNLIKSHHFPSAPKESIVADWLQTLTQKNQLSAEDLRNVIDWLNGVDDVTSKLKSKFIQIVSQYFKSNPLQKADVLSLLSFLENSKLSTQLAFHTEECLTIAITLLKHLKSEETDSNNHLSQRVFNNIVKFYKDSKKKLEFISKVLDGENLETIFSYINSDRSTVVAVCGNILFPMNKKSFFAIYLQTLVRKDNIDDLITEKGDNIQSVLKIMDTFFSFPKGRKTTDQKFLTDFIDIFVSCYYTESQLIFAFYIMVANSLNMEQNYISPAMTMPPTTFEESSDKVKRNIFSNMLETVLRNEVDINVRLSDTLGVKKIPKIETKKTFLIFLETVMLGQLKLDKKPDKATFQIIKTALKLDPTLIESKITDILPPVMTAKKNNAYIGETYKEMLHCLLETLFKLSRGTLFLNQILPKIKTGLEAVNTEQTDLRQKLIDFIENGEDTIKINNKIITGSDVFPKESIELYGKLTCELMFRQNKDFLTSLQKDFEDHCLATLEQKDISPSTVILTEVISAIFCSFLCHSKMADHTVPLNVAEDFWSTFKSFEIDCLKRFGKCVLNVDEPTLLTSFLHLCKSCAHLKLLNIKYSNVKVDIPSEDFSSEILDLSVVLPCLNGDQWAKLAAKVEDDEEVLLLDELLLLKTMVIQTVQRNSETSQNLIIPTKTYIIKQLSKNPQMFDHKDYLSTVLLTNLDKSQAKQVAKAIVKLSLNNSDFDIFNNEAIANNRLLLNCLVLEVVTQMCKCFKNTEDLAKAVNKTDFDMASFAKERDMKQFFTQMTINEQDPLANCIEILKRLKIYYLEESCQLVAMVMLLATKNNAKKKLRRSVDHLLQSLFELSAYPPDLYKIFPVEFIFSFKDNLLLDLLTLKIKVSNNMFVIKCLVDSAVKRVRKETEIVKKIVELMVKKQTETSDTSIEFFSDPAFQISCAILPSIVKQKRFLTQSAPRSILADFQEKLHKSLLECFKKIDFKDIGSISVEQTSNTDDSMVVSERTVATLNAIAAYTLTLAKYCETNDEREMKNLDYLWNGLEYFVEHAIKTLQSPDSKHQHIESSIQLLNTVLRYIKKLETHDIFMTKDKLFVQIWSSIKSRLALELKQEKSVNLLCLEDISVNLRFLCELVSVEGFITNFLDDLNSLAQFVSPTKFLKNEEQSKTILISHRVSKYLWTQILKANIVGPKCVALSKSIYQSSRNLKTYIQQKFDVDQNGVVIKSKRKKLTVEFQNEDNDCEVKIVKIDDRICEMIKIHLETLTEAVLSAKKVSLDYKALDVIFQLLHSVVYILSGNIRARCDVTSEAFYKLFEGSTSVLNALLVSREELLEDRWPCYMQCYRALATRVCARAAATEPLDRAAEHSLGLMAHAVEKLTQSICKRKTHVSKIAAYTVGDLCSSIERCVPSRMVRQHLENSISLLIQASDTAHAMAFLRRALAGSPGQVTMTNMYTMYKRYHKYVGNA